MNHAALDALLNRFCQMRRGPAGCALGVSLDGRTAYEGFCGYADEERRRPIEKDTLYRLYSSTKVVTTVAMMILLEHGLYQLDDPLSDYLPEFSEARYVESAGNNTQTSFPVRSLTIKHLLTMTSGLTYGGNLNTTQQHISRAMAELESSSFTVRDFARRIARVPLAFEPGTHWNYGMNLDVLAAVIEVLSGKPFGQFLSDEIFTPLGLCDTVFFPSDAQRKRLAVLYQYDAAERRTPNLSEEHKFKESYGFECGGGGLVSSLGDTLRFAAMLSLGGTLDGVRILGRKSIDLMRQNHITGQALADFQTTHRRGWAFMSGYGYGLGVKTLIDPAMANTLGTAGEFSWAGAAGTLTLVDPIERLAIVYMHQLMPDNQEGVCHPRIRNVVYGLL